MPAVETVESVHALYMFKLNGGFDYKLYLYFYKQFHIEI